MNAKTVALFILFLAFGFVAKAGDSYSANAEIPGGIVYSDGKDAIYYDFGTKKSKNLTSDFSEAVVKHPFAVSDNGKFLIWLQNSKFYAKELPMGVPHTVQVNKAVYKGTKTRRTSSSKDDIIEDIVWTGNDIKNMTMSPDGSRFAFDTIFQEPGWVFTGKSVYGEAGSITGVYPFYTKMINSYNGIFYLSTILNKSESPRNNPISAGGTPMIQFFRPRYGNIIESPPVPLYTASLKDIPLSSFASPPSHIVGVGNYYIRIGFGGRLDNSKMISSKGGIKKSAHYLTFQNSQNWEQGRKLAAFIWQIGNQWGPIELRVLDSREQGGQGDEIYQGSVSYFGSKDAPEKVQKCREWEILVSSNSKSCEGLFWKPDGSLTILSGGDLYSIDASQIQKGIDNSGVTKKQKVGKIKFLPFNNIFTAEPKLIAQGINGACLSWVSNNAFLFLDRDMTVCLWNQGKKEKMLYSPIPSQFYYCSSSPFKGIKNLDIVAANNKSSDPPVISGANKEAMEGTSNLLNSANRTEKAEISFGPIQTLWTRGGRDAVLILLKFLHKETKPLQFVLITDEDNLDNIKNPSQYEYSSGQKRMVTVLNNNPEARRAYQKSLNDSKKNILGENIIGHVHDEMKTHDDVLVPLDGIIILKLDTAYVAIKPISLRLKYKSIEEIPDWVKKSYRKEIEAGKVPLIYDLMTYEWKYWPKVIPLKGAIVQKAERKKTWEISAIPIGKEFYISGTKFLWKEIPKKEDPKIDKNRKFILEFVSSYENRNEYIGYFHDSLRTSIFDPSRYEFQSYRTFHIETSWWENKDHILILKIGEKYIAIKPIEERGGWIQYQWKCWPEVQPVELAKTALNK